MMKHPIKRWFKNTTTGELEPLGEGVKQIHARDTDVLKLLETLHPFRELFLIDTPLATNSKGGQFLSLNHAMDGSPGQLQQVSSLLEGQQAQRLGRVLHGCFHARNLSNGNAIALLSRVGRFLENAGALSYASLIPSRGFGTNRSTSARNTRGSTGLAGNR
jgi:hypothetical protein